MYSKALDKVIWFIRQLLIFLLGASVVIVSFQIIFRYLFNRPLNWSEQTARCIFIWMTMLSVPCIFRAKGMIIFDLLVNAMPEKVKYVLALLVDCIVMFFAVCFFWFSTQLCINTGARVMAGVEIPQNLIYISMPIAMFLLALVILEQMMDTCKKLKNGGQSK